MLFSNFVWAGGSTADNSITSNVSASGSVVIVHTDVLDESEYRKHPPTPWKRSHAAYEPRCRVTPDFMNGRRQYTTQRPRDGLHAVN